MSADTFVDTNILIYAHDLDAGSKDATAAALVKSLWESETVLHASELQERYQISFWDGMIAAAACAGDATVILSEDLNHGQLIEGIRIENPFVVQAE